MEQVREDILAGRLAFQEGLTIKALQLWKQALGSAYGLKDYASMYVLSINLGDYYRTQYEFIPTSDTKVEEQQKLLLQAADYYKYASEILVKCSLSETASQYPILWNSLKHLKRKQMEIRRKNAAIQTPEMDRYCTTCNVLTNDIVLDEVDGCIYCESCYNAYYESLDRGKDQDKAYSGIPQSNSINSIISHKRNTDISTTMQNSKSEPNSLTISSPRANTQKKIYSIPFLLSLQNNEQYQVCPIALNSWVKQIKNTKV